MHCLEKKINILTRKVLTNVTIDWRLITEDYTRLPFCIRQRDLHMKERREEAQYIERLKKASNDKHLLYSQIREP